MSIVRVIWLCEWCGAHHDSWDGTQRIGISIKNAKKDLISGLDFDSWTCVAAYAERQTEMGK